MPIPSLANLGANELEHWAKRITGDRVHSDEIRAIAAWLDSRPIVPQGGWTADFGPFVVMGAGNKPLTVLPEGSFGTYHGRGCARIAVPTQFRLSKRSNNTQLADRLTTTWQKLHKEAFMTFCQFLGNQIHKPRQHNLFS
jgi:hypothetical protein